MNGKTKTEAVRNHAEVAEVLRCGGERWICQTTMLPGGGEGSAQIRRVGIYEHKRLLLLRRSVHIFIYENYGVRKVYLFGSLNQPERFHDKSDIDLVVDGLPPRLYFKALAELWRLLPAGMELDLIPFEDADSELHERVVKEGVTLSG